MPRNARSVFVIDDDHSVRRGLARLLASAGFRVETFESALAFLARSPPRGEHCLVVDVRMPKMSGAELRDALRAAGRDSPVVFASAQVIDHVEEDPGGDTVLAKPMDLDELLRAIEAAIGGRGRAASKRVRRKR